MSANRIQMKFVSKVQLWLFTAQAHDLLTKKIFTCVFFVASVIYHNFRYSNILHPISNLKLQSVLLGVQYLGFMSFKSTRSSQSCNFCKILQYWKNLGYPHQDIKINLFATLFNTDGDLRVSFSAGYTGSVKKCEPVWAETAQKLELLSPQNRYIGPQGGRWMIKSKPIFFC